MECPLTKRVMVDPVVAEDGRTYEKAAILNWLEEHTTSPLDPSTTISARSRRTPSTLYSVIECAGIVRCLILSGTAHLMDRLETRPSVNTATRLGVPCLNQNKWRERHTPLSVDSGATESRVREVRSNN